MAQTFRNRIIDYGVKPADQFLANPKNARVHPQFQRDVMKAALEEVGFVAPVIESKSGVLLDGHERIWQAMQNDNAAVPFVVVDVDEAEEDYVLATFDPITSLANYDARLLDDLLRDVNSDQPAIQQMLAELAENNGLYGDEGSGVDDPGAQIDRAAQLQEQWQVKRGDLWIIPSKSGKGVHRLLCGDSTNADDVARVMGRERADCMWTDPPYGVNYVGKTADALTIENDGADGLNALLQDAFAALDDGLCDGAAIYIAHPPGALSVTFGVRFLAQGWRLHQTLAWVKDSMVLGHSDYHYKHEPILFGYKDGGGRRGRGGEGWYGDNSQTSVLEFARPKASEEHPTMKPVELVAYCLRNSSPPHGIVLDGFNGSGTTLTACEQTGRIGRGIELVEKYVAVTLQRLADMGLTPELQGAT